MRTIEFASAFKRDLKRESAGPHRKVVDNLVSTVAAVLAADQSLPAANQDHALAGEWLSYRDCHLRGNLVMIYRKPSSTVLRLVRLGSHSELFGK